MIGSQLFPTKVTSLNQALNIARLVDAAVWAIVVGEENPLFHTGIRKSSVYKIYPGGRIEEYGLLPAA